MKLWTIQPVEVYEQIKADGKYIFDYEKSANAKDFAREYKWLEKEMADRGISKSFCDDGMVWAWHTYAGKRHKPDLRQGGYNKRGTKAVCMEIEIPDNKALLSDLDAWHYVLNNWYIGNSQNDEEWEREQAWLASLLPEDRQSYIEKSWQKIFDITPIISEWKINGQYVQATFYDLFLENIKKVQYFICK